ncbi:MAG: alpha-2-macroglobulin [Chitinophagales bacterium]|nr:MAG: alpha-2-macroglobulin [Chitinophagales bacterium]
MKKNLVVALSVLLICAGWAAINAEKSAFLLPDPNWNNYEKEWNEVDSLMQAGLPRSALTRIEHIYAAARKEKNHPQVVKALLYRAGAEYQFEEEPQASVISLLERELPHLTFPQKQFAQSILASLYWRYYQINRYRILNRTATDGFVPDDFKTWDAEKFVRRVSELFLSSLKPEDSLKVLPVDLFYPLLDHTKESKVYRPTLFDFFAHRALEFFQNSESGLTRPLYQFSLDDPAFFAPPEAFIRIQVQSRDTLSFIYQAVLIWQKLLAFHLQRADWAALGDADLHRLRFIFTYYRGEDKENLFMQALLHHQQQYASDTAVAAFSGFERARFLYDVGRRYQRGNDSLRWKKRDAYQQCQRIIELYPGTKGAANCRMLLEEIQQPSIGLQLEEVNTPDMPFRAFVRYKNVERLWLRVVRVSPAEEMKLNTVPSAERKQRLLVKPAIQQWQQALPSAGDYNTLTTEIVVPALPAGFYYLLASSTADFSDAYPVAAVSFSVSHLSCITRKGEKGRLEIYVNNRISGKPMKNVSIQTYRKSYDYVKREYVLKDGSVYKTDNNGFRMIAFPKDSEPFFLKLMHKNDSLLVNYPFYDYMGHSEEPTMRNKTFFFTDRAIYRPGQTVYFKALVLQTDGIKNTIRKNFTETVELLDVNYQKVAEVTLVTNEYGTFHGSFVLPHGLLNGTFTLRCKSGSKSIQVEDYKRPRFSVSFQPVTGSFRLYDTAVVEGMAVSYAGAALTRAEVRYRVERTVFFPFLNHFRSPWPSGERMEITSGTTTTDESGGFYFSFRLLPDPSISPDQAPVFHYRVYADITDVNGETQSAQTVVHAGYRAWQATIELGEVLLAGQIDTLRFSIRNLNNQPQEAKGTISIFKLKNPDRLLRPRLWESPDTNIIPREVYIKNFPYDVYENENKHENWERESLVWSSNFDTKRAGFLVLENTAQWPVGMYAAELQTTDPFGQIITEVAYFSVFQEGSGGLPYKTFSWVHLKNQIAEPGQQVELFVGSAAENTRVLYEVMLQDRIIERKWLEIGNRVRKLEIPVTEEYRGNFVVNLVLIRFGRVYNYSHIVEVPFSNKQLHLEATTFRDRLLPGEHEEWQFKITGPQGEKVMAEMLAAMYDASLDAFVPHGWGLPIYNPFNYFGKSWNSHTFSVSTGILFSFHQGSRISLQYPRYDQLNWFWLKEYYPFTRWDDLPGMYRMHKQSTSAGEGPVTESIRDALSAMGEDAPVKDEEARENKMPLSQTIPLSPQVIIRKDLQETAFFYPQLKTDTAGQVLLSFKAPEALTRWKFMALAHTQDLKTGTWIFEAVTQKSLMVIPNAPRFFREKDTMDFMIKISSLANEDVQGAARLMLFDAFTLQPVDDAFDNRSGVRNFSLKKGQSTSVSWKLKIPEGISAVVYRVSASANGFTDGEENMLPVLTNRMLVTETMPIHVRGGQTKEFTFTRLMHATASPTLRHHQLKLEFAANPVWYAVQSLPYLMEYPYECAEQIFNRYYANSIAGSIVGSSPRIRQVFETWQHITPEALLSNLEKNADLKAVLLEETPWVLDAKNITEKQRRLALLCDFNRMASGSQAALKKLEETQLPNGGWPWFKGMPDNRFITQYIIIGLGRLLKLHAVPAAQIPRINEMLIHAVRYMDGRAHEDYAKAMKSSAPDDDHLGYVQIQYVYARSFFPEIPFSPEANAAFKYYLNQAEKYGLKKNIFAQGMLALALHRQGIKQQAGNLIASLKERALWSDELGMYWSQNAAGYLWHEAPVETQALLIEAFDEIAADTFSVNNMRIWLLKQKQVQDWQTTKATADACYALLLRGTDWIKETPAVTIQVAGKPITTDMSAEAGTGYLMTSWTQPDIVPKMGKVSVTLGGSSIGWGAMYWQYFEQLDKITSHETPLKLKKQLFVEVHTDRGPLMRPVNEQTPLKPGDLIKVRIELRCDRDMEFIHMKDMRAAGFEPVQVLSGYRWQGGLGYYESTRDAATHFFIDWLPKGTYVFEYALRVAQRGNFSNGITTIQSMYAPSFAAHSEGIRVRVE